MTTETPKGAYLKGVHPYAFRCGESALITGVKYVEPTGCKSRVCYEVTFNDGYIDFVPVSEVTFGNYRVGSKP